MERLKEILAIPFLLVLQPLWIVLVIYVGLLNLFFGIYRERCLSKQQNRHFLLKCIRGDVSYVDYILTAFIPSIAILHQFVPKCYLCRLVKQRYNPDNGL